MKNEQKIIEDILEKMFLIPKNEIILSIKLYKLVRTLYNKDTNISSNVEFCWAYENYYGLSLHYMKADINTYFAVLKAHVQDKSTMKIDDIVSELSTKNKHYVFASKLMNFVDDEQYPIVDRNVCSLFGFKPSETYSYRYDAICRVYTKLSKNRRVLKYISNFPFDGIGIMKILDILAWNIAKLPKE